MKKYLLVPLVLLLSGSIVTVVGANSYLSETSYALCSACGMKVSISDPSTLVVKVPGQSDLYGCCPVCAAEIGLYYKNATVSGQCINCGKQISFAVKNGALSTSTSPDACMLAGGMCAKNKLACSAACQSALTTKYDWAPSASVKTSTQFFTMAQTKLSGATLTPKPVTPSMPVYAMLGVGGVLIVAAPVSWFLLRKRA